MMRSALMMCGSPLVAAAALPCTIVVDEAHPRPTLQALVRDADAIVVATPVRTIALPDRDRLFARGPGDDDDRLLYGTVEMRVDETIHGVVGAAPLVFPGRLVETDDFNPGPAPYTAARPG